MTIPHQLAWYVIAYFTYIYVLFYQYIGVCKSLQYDFLRNLHSFSPFLCDICLGWQIRGLSWNSKHHPMALELLSFLNMWLFHSDCSFLTKASTNIWYVVLFSGLRRAKLFRWHDPGMSWLKLGASRWSLSMCCTKSKENFYVKHPPLCQK